MTPATGRNLEQERSAILLLDGDQWACFDTHTVVVVFAIALAMTVVPVALAYIHPIVSPGA